MITDKDILRLKRLVKRMEKDIDQLRTMTDRLDGIERTYIASAITDLNRARGYVAEACE